MIKGILRVLGLIVVSVLFIGGAYLGGFLVSMQVVRPVSATSPGDLTPSDWKPEFAVFWEAWNYVHQDFYKLPIDDQRLTNGAVTGMIEALGDPHTSFVDSQRAAINRTDLQGSFEGIGATVEMREGRLTIVAPITGSPAEKAGILPGDIVLEVDGKVIQGMDITQAISLIRGPKGTTVRLKIQRQRQSPFEVSIVRDTIRTTFVTSRMVEGTSIAYVRLNDFGATAPEELRSALQKLNTENPKGLIFDLRRNPGGYLNVAVDITSQFLKQGQQVLLEKDKNGIRRQVAARPGGLATDIPMVLLIDEGSASASEIVAAALRDHKRATIIGQKSFGKGSVQNVHALSDKSELRVTISHFYGPKDTEIHDVGIKPDIEVVMTEEDRAKRRDPQLDRAVEFLKKQLGITLLWNVPQTADLAIEV